ncbi:MAG: DUF4004 family protein [Lachnospiraceae bacterium]|nr:DUF4004 family protein [Lachnospiraceae bacterium]MBQ8547822.1 DUF4004 family protein [Lachnospiraceae bacterium]MBQ8846268.1 DUF4004 family protein [Lachnospiraceae bacterium]
MGEELISKKELLEQYGISYGALYRWKRKGLIPEEWFLKKATVTGQETFFPKELICERVELIQNQKDDFSLDELSKQFHKESETKAVLTVKTVYGDKTFYVNEIQQVLLDDGKGEVRDLTQELLGRTGNDRNCASRIDDKYV